MPDHQDRGVALVTGASRGLGEAFAEALARRGFHVVATARTAGALVELTDRISQAGGRANYAAADITSAAAMQQLCRAIYDEWQRLDLFVHAAIHAPALSPVAHSSTRDFARTLKVNCIATARMIEYVAPLLARAPAATSVFFEDNRAGDKFFGAYGSSKACQISVVRSWRRELGARSNIRVEILRPEPMATALRQTFFPGEDRSQLATPQAAAARLVSRLLDSRPPA